MRLYNAFRGTPTAKVLLDQNCFCVVSAKEMEMNAERDLAFERRY